MPTHSHSHPHSNQKPYMQKSVNNLFKGDKVIWMVLFFLFVISIIEVFSASSSLSYKGGNYWGPVIKHTGLLLVGLGAAIVLQNIPCKNFRVLTPLLLLFSFITLVYVLVLGERTNDGARWMNLMGIAFQPSEVGKGALVFAAAQILSSLQTEHGAEQRACKYILITSSFIILPIALENLSTALLIVIVLLLMMFIGRVPGKTIGKVMGIFMLVGLVFVVFVLAFGHEEKEQQLADPTVTTTQVVTQSEKRTGMLHRFDTWKSRILSFLQPKDYPPEDYPIDEKAQEGHSAIAIASAHFFGKGPGNSVERDYLPQAFSDFIYAIVIEELGLLGAIVVLMLYIILLVRSGKIASRCENNFPAYLAMGLSLLLVTQAMFNMLVAVGLGPVTGQPLPLISKGGTSSIINCCYIGIILSISRSAKKNETAYEKTATSRRKLSAAATS